MALVSEALDCRRAMISRHARPDDRKGLSQIAATLLPIAGLWLCIALVAEQSAWLAAAATALMSLFLLRVFVLMHECGHGSLFRTAALNRGWGFVLGVVAGIPQPVWSQHHHYHHATNGNWARYRGPLNVITEDAYAAMTRSQQRRYRYTRNIWLAPLAGFLYLVVNPRLTWLRGSGALLGYLVARKRAIAVTAPGPQAAFGTPYCNCIGDYMHMFWNNVALLSLWGAMAWAIGPAVFFSCYAIAISLAGGAAIVLFTVQHNFENSYASGDQDWCCTTAALAGTSFLVLPRWLNWFTANIAYHHVHHLCAGIPNYRLAQCHEEQASLFRGVTRIRLAQIPHALTHILWDTASRRIISVAEHQRLAILRNAG